MARQFNGTNQSLKSANFVDLSAYSTLTLALWVYWDAYLDDDTILIEHSANAFNQSFNIIPSASGVGGKVFVRLGDASGDKAGTFPRTTATAAAWHQWIVEFDKTAGVGVLGIKAWIDNVSQTMTTVADPAQSNPFPGSVNLNFMSRNNASLWAAGRLFAPAIYSGVLTSGQRADLQTKAPNDIGNTPLHYWLVDGVASPEPATLGGVALTVNGATQVANPLTFEGSNAAYITFRKA